MHSLYSTCHERNSVVRPLTFFLCFQTCPCEFNHVHTPADYLCPIVTRYSSCSEQRTSIFFVSASRPTASTSQLERWAHCRTVWAKPNQTDMNNPIVMSKAGYHCFELVHCSHNKVLTQLGDRFSPRYLYALTRTQASVIPARWWTQTNGSTRNIPP